MDANRLTSHHLAAHTPAGAGSSHLMLGSVAVTRLLGGDATGGAFSLVELLGAPDSGPGPHRDPWRESFYVLEGELTFRCEDEGGVRTIVARTGDTVTIPEGLGHAFRVTSAAPARFLIMSTPSGIDAFFADAGQPIPRLELPAAPPPVDRERLQQAFVRHGLSPFQFAAAADASAPVPRHG